MTSARGLLVAATAFASYLAMSGASQSELAEALDHETLVSRTLSSDSDSEALERLPASPSGFTQRLSDKLFHARSIRPVEEEKHCHQHWNSWPTARLRLDPLSRSNSDLPPEQITQRMPDGFRPLPEDILRRLHATSGGAS